jgi:hypothetical protein
MKCGKKFQVRYLAPDSKFKIPNSKIKIKIKGV